jgi:predicted dehydrogenase
MLANYLREIGLKEVARKVRSRLGERRRNDKLVSCGVGRVLEAPVDGTFAVGALVGFVAPSHPRCVERVVLPEGLLASADDAWERALDDGEVLHERMRGQAEAPELTSVAGWSPQAGARLSAPAVSDTLRRWLPSSPDELDWSRTSRLPVRPDSLPAERRRAAPRDQAKGQRDRPSAVLFGYGNYAKTALLPHVSSALRVECVHELDPLQIPSDSAGSLAWDTSPLPRPDEHYDVYLIAGYHASHAPLAAEALRRKASAVVEKPVATNEEQLEGLLTELAGGQGRVFSCYQRRYSPLTAFARHDLDLSAGEPVSYHCIVYEVPLPPRHWYRWPSSGSRLLSNGCHWIDHFLDLNDFSDTLEHEVLLGPDETINCSLELANGAFFTMALTDAGSARLGVRDHVELRRGNRTVTIEDNSSYRAECTARALRKARVNKTESYRAMYRKIARRIVTGVPGDSVRSLRSSAGTVIALERALEAAKQARAASARP